MGGVNVSRTILAPAVAALALGVFIGLALSGRLITEAVQAPRISFDVDPTGNTYSDPGAGGNNSMAVGPIDNCLTTTAPGNNAAHTHIVQLIIKNVEDLIGWQARVSYLGTRWRPTAVNFAPFTDSNTLQNVSFVNLPIDANTGTHRDLSTASKIPVAAPGPQTAAFGSVYLATQNAAVSPDTPAKRIPDDGSYSAPTGGVLAAVQTSVPGFNAGSASLFLNLDDSSPDPPGSGISFFNGTKSEAVELFDSALGDAFHGEGKTCAPLDCTTQDCPAYVVVNNNSFTNNTGQAASDLHVTFDQQVVEARVVQQPEGCPLPNLGGPPGSRGVDVDWGIACVPQGGQVVLEITSEPPVSPQCSHWAVAGTPIGTPCPPVPTPNPCPPGPATPKPSTITDTFTNETNSSSATDLHALYNNPVAVCLLQNAPGCPEPTLASTSSQDGFDMDWGTNCVEVGESVVVQITSKPPVSRVCSDWTTYGRAFGTAGPVACSVIPTPGPTPFRFVSESAVFDPATQEVLFTIIFNQPPDFLTTDDFGRQRHEFQYYIVGSPFLSDPSNYDAIIRGGEIHSTVDQIRIRNARPTDPDPSSGGWGSIRGTVPFRLNGAMLTFSVPLRVISDHSTDGIFEYQLLVAEFGGGGNQANSRSIVAPPTTTTQKGGANYSYRALAQVSSESRRQISVQAFQGHAFVYLPNAPFPGGTHASADLIVGQFEMDKNLSSAHIQATLAGQSCSRTCTPATVTIDLTWVAQGNPQNAPLGQGKDPGGCSLPPNRQTYTNADVSGTINGETVEGIGSLIRVAYPPGGGDGQCKK